jgi:hypothetical protein
MDSTLEKIRTDVIAEVTDDIRILMGEEEPTRWVGLRVRILQISRQIEQRTLKFRWSSCESYRVRHAASEGLRERGYNL